MRSINLLYVKVKVKSNIESEIGVEELRRRSINLLFVKVKVKSTSESEIGVERVAEYEFTVCESEIYQ